MIFIDVWPEANLPGSAEVPRRCEGLGELDLVLATLSMKSATLDYDKNHITPLF